MTEAGAITGAAMLTDGFPVLLAVPTTTKAALALEGYLGKGLLGINGPEDAAKAFKEAHCAEWVPELKLVCYEATKESLTTTPLLSGERIRWLKGDNDADLALLTTLIDDFSDAVHQRPSGHLAARRLKEGTAKFLVLQNQDNAVCSLAASARTTPRYAVITSVFTPAPWRRKGCARRTVSAIATALLEEKEKLALFADADEIGPNLLYSSLGFSPVNTMQAWKPSPPADDEQ